MWQRFTLKDVRIIGHYLGVLILFSTLTMVPPLITAIVLQEWEPAGHYLFGIGVALVVGSALRFLSISPAKLNRQQAMAVTGLAWFVLAFVASVPLGMSGHYANYVDVLFDCVSAWTTTGATVIQDLDHLSNADNMFRFMMHFVGGLGLIVIALSFGLFRKGGAGLYSSEGRSEHVIPNVIQTTQYITRIAVVIILAATVILTVFCFFAGMEPVRAFLQAFWLSISGFNTGGFTPMSQSVMYYHSFPIEMLLMLLMMFGSINFVLFAEVGNGRIQSFFRDIEIRTIVIWLMVCTLVFAAALSSSTTFNSMPAMLRRGLFIVVSAFSTTGFQTVTSNQLTTVFTSGAFLVLAALMAVGGSAGSTSGGLKIMRVGIIAKSIVSTIKEALSPDSARVVVDYQHVGRRVLSAELVKEAMTVFILYVITYALGTLIGIAHGHDAVAAVFESVAMASNGGLIVNISPEMPWTLEFFYIIEMWAGRLEFITFFAVLVKIVVSVNPRRWRLDRRER